MLNLVKGTRGRDDPDSPFFAEALPRGTWDPDSKPTLRNIERVVLIHRLREVMALVGFTRFEPAGTDEKGELDLDGIAPAALSPEPEWFPAIENRGVRSLDSARHQGRNDLSWLFCLLRRGSPAAGSRRPLLHDQLLAGRGEGACSTPPAYSPGERSSPKSADGRQLQRRHGGVDANIEPEDVQLEPLVGGERSVRLGP